MQLSRALNAFSLLSLFAAGSAGAFTPTGDCTSWASSANWQGPAWAEAVASLKIIQSDGTGLVVQQSTDTVLLGSGDTFLGFSGSWAPIAADGQYIISIDVTIYDDVDHVPTATELAAWPQSRTFEFNGGTSWPPFTCTEAPPSDNDARTPGFWKNHPEDWPVDALQIGYESSDQACLLSALHQKTKGDIRVKLLHHLIAAKLNVMPNDDDELGRVDPTQTTDVPAWGDDVADTIDFADSILAGSPLVCPEGELTGKKPKGYSKQVAESAKDALDTFNNNNL